MNEQTNLAQGNQAQRHQRNQSINQSVNVLLLLSSGWLVGWLVFEEEISSRWMDCLPATWKRKRTFNSMN